MEINCEISLMLLIGIPGAGKSTVCQHLLRKQSQTRFIHICFDEIQREQECNQSNAFNKEQLSRSVTYKEFRSYCFRFVESLIELILRKRDLTNISSQYLNELRRKITLNSEYTNMVFLIDDNMFYRSMRYQYYQLTQKYCLRFGQLYINTPLSLCMLRNSQRDEPIPEETLMTMNENLQPPSPECQPWERHSLAFHPDGDSDELLSFVRDLTRSEPPPPAQKEEIVREKSRNLSSTDLTHQTDLILRQLVKQNIHNFTGDKSDKKEFAQKINRLRTTLLDRVRKENQVIISSLMQEVENSHLQPNSELYQFISKMWYTEIQKS